MFMLFVYSPYPDVQSAAVRLVSNFRLVGPTDHLQIPVKVYIIA